MGIGLVDPKVEALFGVARLVIIHAAARQHMRRLIVWIRQSVDPGQHVIPVILICYRVRGEGCFRGLGNRDGTVEAPGIVSVAENLQLAQSGFHGQVRTVRRFSFGALCGKDFCAKAFRLASRNPFHLLLGQGPEPVRCFRLQLVPKYRQLDLRNGLLPLLRVAVQILRTLRIPVGPRAQVKLAVDVPEDTILRQRCAVSKEAIPQRKDVLPGIDGRFHRIIDQIIRVHSGDVDGRTVHQGRNLALPAGDPEPVEGEQDTDVLCIRQIDQLAPGQILLGHQRRKSGLKIVRSLQYGLLGFLGGDDGVVSHAAPVLRHRAGPAGLRQPVPFQPHDAVAAYGQQPDLFKVPGFQLLRRILPDGIENIGRVGAGQAAVSVADRRMAGGQTQQRLDLFAAGFHDGIPVIGGPFLSRRLLRIIDLCAGGEPMLLV